jgi:hypothetical protein
MSESETGLRAAAELHHHYFTGLILYVLQCKGEDAVAELVRRTFHAQHDEKFLPGLKALGLDGLPHAVACARYFYLANLAGGVRVECIEESPRKAWIRYPPPRWIWEGAAICAVPSAVSLGFPRGFHARCGESLGNPRLGFVLTGVTTDGDPGLEGYFIEEDRPLAAHERLRFARGERAPRFDAEAAPRLPWGEERIAKARRNYALQYIRTALPVLLEQLPDGGALARQAARLIGLQLYESTAALLGRREFGDWLADVLAGCGEAVARDGQDIVQRGWRLMAGKPGADRLMHAWSGLFDGAAAAHDRALSITAERRGGDWLWRLAPAGR